MFTLTFFLVLSLVTYLNNRMNQIDGANPDSYTFDKTGGLVILGMMLLSFLLNFVMKTFLHGLYWYGVAVFAIACFVGIYITNYFRMEKIKRKKEQVMEIYNILDMITKPPKSNQEFDFNNIPFELEYDPMNAKQVKKIKFKVTDHKVFTDLAMVQGVNALNKMLPYKTWMSRVDMENRIAEFIGNKVAPKMAEYPGSELRPWNWIPIGVNGIGELGWNLGVKKKNIGRSQFKYEDTGQLAGTVDISKAPQALTLGSTGGGKAIVLDEVVEVMD